MRLKYTLVLILVNILSIFKIKTKYISPTLTFFWQNKQFWKNKYLTTKLSENYLLVEINNNIFMALGTATLANLIAISKNLKIIYLVTKPDHASGYMNRIRESFTNIEYWRMDQYLSENKEFIDEKSQTLYSSLNSVNEIKKLKYNNVLIGDIVYDEALRNGEWLSTIKSIDDRVYRSIHESISYIESISYLEKVKNITSACFSHGTSYGGIVLRYFAIKEKINYMGIIGSGPIRKFSSFTNRNPWTAEPPISFIKNLLDDSKSRAKLLSDANKFIDNKFSGNLNHFDAKRAFSKENKFYFSKAEFCTEFELNNGKKNIFIMLHAFNDYPNHFDCVFNDYFDWFIATLGIAERNDKVNWIFKEHPSAKFYPTNDLNLKSYFENVPDNIILLDSDKKINSKSLLNICDGVITVSGTASLEFSGFGIPSIICSDNYFSSYGICYEAKNKDDYKNVLSNIESIDSLDKDKQEDAKIINYIIFGILSGNNKNSYGIFTCISDHEARLRNNVRECFEFLCQIFGYE